VLRQVLQFLLNFSANGQFYTMPHL
jgi:hypothetical protein